MAADADSEDEEANLLHTVTGYANPETGQELTIGPDFLVQVRDLSEPGVFIEPLTLEITEGFDDAYSVSLRTEPSRGRNGSGSGPRGHGREGDARQPHLQFLGLERAAGRHGHDCGG